MVKATRWACLSIAVLCCVVCKIDKTLAQDAGGTDPAAATAPQPEGSGEPGGAAASDAGTPQGAGPDPGGPPPSATSYEPAPEVVEATSSDVVSSEQTVTGSAEPVDPPSDVMIVTAQFRKQNAQRTPLSITALSSEQMRDRGQVNTVDLGSASPNVNLSPGTGVYGPALQAFIRGAGQSDFNYALEPGVGIYVDDVYYATLTGTIIDLMDLECVEILRGPQGTLTGQNSIGGAIRLYSRKPRGGNNGHIQATYGSFDRAEARAAGDFTLVKHKLFGRISGVANHTDGYVTRYDYACTHPGTTVPTFQNGTSCKLGTEGGRAYAGMRAAFRWTPTDSVELTVSGDFTKDNSEATPNTLLYVGTPAGPGAPPLPSLSLGGVSLGDATGSPFISRSPFGGYALDTYSNSPYVNYSTYVNPQSSNGFTPYSVPPGYRTDSGGASARLEVELPKDLSLLMLSSYRQYNGDWSLDEGTPIGGMTLQNVVSNRQVTEELRLSGKLFRDAVDFTVGGFYLWRKSRYQGRIALPGPPPLGVLDFLEDSVIPAQTAAGFANVEWHVTDSLDLIAGGRYTWQKKSYEYGRDFVPGAPVNPLIAPIDGQVGRFDGGRGDYRGAVEYQWLPELMTYAQVATGFKGGGVNPRPFTPNQVFSHKPETMIGYELGVKTDFFERRLQVNAAGFFNQYRDILTSVSVCPNEAPGVPCFAPLNAGKAHIGGFELEANTRPLKHFEIDGSIGYLKFKYDSISGAGASSGITKDMKGAYTPKWQMRGGTTYHFVMGSWGSISPRLDLIYQSPYHTNPVNSRFDLVDSRLLLNGRLSWTSSDETWQASLELMNITNRLYYLNVTDARTTAFTVNGQPAPPFRWAISLRRNFM